MSDELVERRKAQEAAHEAAQKPIAAVVDTADGLPASDANPTHQEDFKRLLGAAARTRTQED